MFDLGVWIVGRQRAQCYNRAPSLTGGYLVQASETIEVTTGDKPDRAVIWLHGLGADGNDFVPIVPELDLENTRFVFPHAPVRPVTLNNNMPMRAWFDIRSLDHHARDAIDTAGIAQSIASVNKLVADQQQYGIPPTRIVLAGFSQGGAVALAAGLSMPTPVAGLIGLSTWAAFAAPQHGCSMPVFLGHGEFDPMVNPSLGEQTRETLEAAGCKVQWHTYPMAHSVCAEEITDIAAFLRTVLA